MKCDRRFEWGFPPAKRCESTGDLACVECAPLVMYECPHGKTLKLGLYCKRCLDLAMSGFEI
jgi:hypothetical protein